MPYQQHCGRRERRCSWGRAARCDGNRVPSVVESVSKILREVCNDVTDVQREFLSQLDLVNRMARLIRIRLNNSLVSVAVDELHDFNVKIMQVFLSPSDLAMRTLERV